MLFDARRLHGSPEICVPVCIVGGGVAGIVLALELARRGIECCVMEAGGERFSHRSQAFYAGEADGSRYDLAASRARLFGGSSHCWGGWTRPFDGQDFGGRPCFPGLGWPIGPEALRPHLAQAYRHLLIAPSAEGTDAEGAAGDLADHATALLAPVAGERLRTIFFRMSPPARFGRLYRDRLAADPRVAVLLNAPVVEIMASATSPVVRGVRARMPWGDLVVRARYVVLAAGGIENPRLMLASRGVWPKGIGNERDLVGRYFMDHPRLRLGRVRLLDAARFSRLYDVRHYGGGSFLVPRGKIGAALAPAPAEQARAGILQSYTGLLACYLGQDHAVTHDVTQLCKALAGQVHERITFATLGRALRSLPVVGGSLLARKVGVRNAVREFELETVLEPWPDPENRVSLTTERDRLGLPKVRLRWRPGELERRSHRHAVELVRQAVEGPGLGTVSLPLDAWGEGWAERVLTTWHHMGTTRMGRSPSDGVVDADCRVFGLGNLYVAGSSVFPTGGGSPPTLSIVALALRLAGHIAAAAARPQAEAAPGRRRVSVA